MKPGDQIKVIVLSFFSIVVMIGVITVVSMMTTQAVASHHGGGHGDDAGHGAATSHESSDSHAAPKSDDHASDNSHSSTTTKTETHTTDTHTETKTETHATTTDAHGDKDAHATDSHETPKEEHHNDTDAHSTDTKTEAVKTAAVEGDVEAGKAVFKAKTCIVCHKVASVEGAVGAIGPALDGLGKVAGTRVSGMSAVDYIKQSIEEPNAFVVEGYPAAMTPMRSQMSDEEFTNLVAFLGTL